MKIFQRKWLAICQKKLIFTLVILASGLFFFFAEKVNADTPAVIDLGAWGTRSSPRRTGFSYNWALSGATAGSVHSGGGVGDIISNGMHTGVAGQVASLDAVLIWIGANDYNEWNNTFQDVYNGVVAGQALTDKENSIVANIQTAVTTIDNAGSAKILLTNIIDPYPGWAGRYPNATYGQRVTDSVNRVNTRIDSIISANPNVFLMDRNGWGAVLVSEYPPVGMEYIVVGGQNFYFTNGDEPHHFLLADAGHYSTVFSGLVANICIIDALNEAGFDIPRLTDSQILKQAGLASDNSTPVFETLRLGVVGDSGLDEYQADDNRGGDYHSVTFNPIEMMHNILVGSADDVTSPASPNGLSVE